MFQAINGLADRSTLLNDIGIFFAEYLAYVLGVILLVIWFMPSTRRAFNRRMISIALLSGLIARFIVKELIILVYHRPRPYIALSGVHKLISTTVTDNLQSFPSGHAIFFFALAMGLYFFNKKLGIWYLVAASVMSVARVFVGVHWPSDVVAGAILGILVAWGVQAMYTRYNKQSR
jgi:undecaprenyl-diphosphatase